MSPSHASFVLTGLAVCGSIMSPGQPETFLIGNFIGFKEVLIFLSFLRTSFMFTLSNVTIIVLIKDTFEIVLLRFVTKEFKF